MKEKLKQAECKLTAKFMQWKDREIINNENGDGFMTFIIVILIVIAVGAILYAAFTNFFQNEFVPWLVNKIKSTFGM